MIHRYFYPDAPPYATMLRCIAARLVGDGHRVRVLAGMPAYVATTQGLRCERREELDGIEVRRVRLLREQRGRGPRFLLNTSGFLLAVFVTIIRTRPRVVTFSTMPPVVLGLVVRLALSIVKRRGCYIYHCQDLYPEAAEVGELISREHSLYRIAHWVERSTRSNASAVVVLSGDMERTAVRGGSYPARVHVINNFSLVDEDWEERGSRQEDDGFRVIVFAGNLGRFQALNDVVEAVEKLSTRADWLRFLFIGDGLARGELERIRGEHVAFLGYRPPEEVFCLLQNCDVGLVPLKSGLLDVAYPSKVMTYLAAGCGVVAVGDEESELGRTVREFGVGSIAQPGDIDGLADAMVNIAGSAGPQLARRAKECNERLFDRGRALNRWSELVQDIKSGC